MNDSTDETNALLGMDLERAPREDLLDHIALQRKLIRRLYHRLVALEAAQPCPSTYLHAAPGVRFADGVEPMTPLMRPHVAASPMGRGATTSAAAPPPSPFQPAHRYPSPLKTSTRLSSPPPPSSGTTPPVDAPARRGIGAALVPHSDPAIDGMGASYAPPYVYPGVVGQHTLTAGGYGMVGQRLTEELARIDQVLCAHESGDEVLAEDTVADVYRMREKVAYALRTPYVAHPPPNGHQTAHAQVWSNVLPPSVYGGGTAAYDAAPQHHPHHLDEYKFAAQYRGMSAHTAPREKATAEDVAACALWMESPLSSRTNTPPITPLHNHLQHHTSSPAAMGGASSARLRQAGAYVAAKDVPLDDERTCAERDGPHAARRSGDSGVTPPKSLVEKLQAQQQRLVRAAGDGVGATSPQRRASPQTPRSADTNKLLVYRKQRLRQS